MSAQQDELSKSYAESIHSVLNDEDLLEEGMNKNRRGSYQTFVSQHSIAPTIKSSLLSFPPYSNNSNNNNNGQDDIDLDHEPTPLPRLQMLIICIMLLSDPLTSTVILPFIYFMLKDFHLSDDEREIGSYAGWITSIFFVGQFFTAMIWGKVSDRYGRRPVLLIGLIGNSISCCLFGLSKNLWWAIGSRALCGIVNGNGGVARSMISEITDASNRAKAFSLFGFCWGIGLIGPALGGFLCKPAEHFPSIFGDIQFFIDYPYFLPCFVSSIGSFIAFFIGYFYLQESNPAIVAKKEKKQSKVFNDPNDLDESTGLLSSQADESTNDDNIKKSNTIPLFAFSSIGKYSIITIGAYALFAFHCMVFDEVLPLYFSSPAYAGGLQSTSQELAKLLSVCGLWQLLSQFYIFPWLNKFYSTLEMTRFSLILFAGVYFLFPELTTWKTFVEGHYTGDQASIFLNLGYFSLLLVRVFGNCLAFTGMMVMVSNSAEPGMIGLVNGVLQSCLALVRALGPTVGGVLWSFSLKNAHWPFDRHLVYYLITILSILGWIHSYKIPNSLSLGGRRRT